MMCLFQTNHECNGNHRGLVAALQCCASKCVNPKDATFLWECAAKCGLACHSGCTGIGRNSEEDAHRFTIPLCRCCQRRFSFKADFEELQRKQYALTEALDKEAENVKMFRLSWEHAIPITIRDTDDRLKALEEKMADEKNSVTASVKKTEKLFKDIELKIDNLLEKLASIFPHDKDPFSSTHSQINALTHSCQTLITKLQATPTTTEPIKVHPTRVDCAFDTTNFLTRLETYIVDAVASVCRTVSERVDHKLAPIADMQEQLRRLAESAPLPKPQPDGPSIAVELTDIASARDSEINSPSGIPASPSPQVANSPPQWVYLYDHLNNIRCRQRRADYVCKSGWREFLSPDDSLINRVWRESWISFDDANLMQVVKKSKCWKFSSKSNGHSITKNNHNINDNSRNRNNNNDHNSNNDRNINNHRGISNNNNRSNDNNRNNGTGITNNNQHINDNNRNRNVNIDNSRNNNNHRSNNNNNNRSNVNNRINANRDSRCNNDQINNRFVNIRLNRNNIGNNHSRYNNGNRRSNYSRQPHEINMPPNANHNLDGSLNTNIPSESRFIGSQQRETSNSYPPARQYTAQTSSSSAPAFTAHLSAPVSTIQHYNAPLLAPAAVSGCNHLMTSAGAPCQVAPAVFGHGAQPLAPNFIYQ